MCLSLPVLDALSTDCIKNEHNLLVFEKSSEINAQCFKCEFFFMTSSESLSIWGYSLNWLDDKDWYALGRDYLLLWCLVYKKQDGDG